METSPNRRIRVFVSSTFRDMAVERDALMTHAWPELRRFCREYAGQHVRWAHLNPRGPDFVSCECSRTKNRPKNAG